MDKLYVPHILICVFGGVIFMGLFSLPKKETMERTLGEDASQEKALHTE